MKHQGQPNFYQLLIITGLAIGGIFTSSNCQVLAQLKTDNTLGSNNSVIDKVDDFKTIINGGLTKGANLFHSFEKFNVGKNKSVYFSNPTGIENILTRVTGGTHSEILGTLGVYGSANLFLINPQGIIFGNNASLDIQGSFTATTADEIKLGEDGLFSAKAPATSNLLTIQPSALFINSLKNQQATIHNQAHLTVKPGKNITLFGANLINTGTLIAPGGEIQLTGIENLKIRGNIAANTLLIESTNLTIAENNNATINQATLENLSGNTNLIFKATNDITINSLDANTLNLAHGNGAVKFHADTDSNGIGNLQMEITNTIETNSRDISISGANLILGNIDSGYELFGGGNITLSATSGDITTQDLYSNSYSELGTVENAGFIRLTAPGNITTQYINSSSSSAGGTGGNGGAVTLNAGGNISTQYLISLSSSLLGAGGNGGAVTLTAGGNINIQDLINSSSSVFEGTGGNGGAVTLTAGKNITNQEINSSFSGISATAGNGGKITLNAGKNIFTQSLNSSSSSFSGIGGNGGEITLTATEGDIRGIKKVISNGNNLAIKNELNELREQKPVISSGSISNNGTSGQGGNVTLSAKNNIVDLEILTLSSNSKSGDIQVHGFGNLSVINTDMITNQRIEIKNPFRNNPLIRFPELIDAELISFDVSEVGQSGNVTFTSTGHLTFNRSRINSDTRGNNPAGTVTITTPGTLTFNLTQIISNTISTGKAGSIQINAEKFTMTDKSVISASSRRDGDAGDITLNTATLILANNGEIFATTRGTGAGGTITINAPNSVNLGIGVEDSSPILSVETRGTGKAGNIIVNTPNLTISDTAQITATAQKTTTDSGGGGSIILNASKINLAGIVGIFAETQGEAPAGTLQLNPYQNQPDLDISLFPSSIISASTSGSGKGGDLIITAPQNINISGAGKLAVESSASGDAGSISISTANLNITNGVEISAATSGSGKGGNILIEANTFTANNSAKFVTTTSSQFSEGQAGNIIVKVRDNITLDGKSGLFANTTSGAKADSGSIDIDPKIFIIRNGSGIGVNNQGSGKGGNISLQAGLLILDEQAVISAATASNQGGNINLNVQDLLLLRNNSRITASAGTDGAGGDGGNINITAPFVVAFPQENSDITANAFLGNGGRIDITTNAIFGLEKRDQQTPNSDITASSEFGLAGQVQINTPEVDPTSGLIELPGNLVDAESLIAKNICADEQIAKNSSFVITGKGGLPAETDELISNSPGIVEWATRSGIQEKIPVIMENQVVNMQEENVNSPVIQEAQGWIITADGKVILTAEPPKITLQNSALTHPGCHISTAQ